jgi:hypothetical protein
MYLGNQPALSYTSFAKQDFTTSATTSYALSQPVTNENEIALFINFVRQEPTTAYTASGTSLTLTSATSGSDDMYAIFLGKAVQTVNPPAGSVGISQLSATGTKNSTTFLRGDNTFAEAGGGKVLQVVQATVGSVSTTSTSDVDTGLTASITPSSVSNKILIFISHSGVLKYSGATTVGVRIRLYKDGSNLQTIAGEAGWTNVSEYNDAGSVCINYLDSPATTSSITYKTTIAAANASATVSMERGFITLMEIAG